MKHFEYLSDREEHKLRCIIGELIHDVRLELEPDIEFKEYYIGSMSRHMATYERNGNQGFDADINLKIIKSSTIDPSVIKHMFMNAFNKYRAQYGFDYCEDSTRVITMKVKDTKRSKILYGIDFAIIKDHIDLQDKHQYIHFNKSNHKYYWNNQPYGYDLQEKMNWLYSHHYWDQVKERYLEYKNNQPKKKSRALFAQTINDLYNKYYL